MADADLPVLPTNFFNEIPATGPWDFAKDFKDVAEIGKGKDTLIYKALCPKLGNREVAVKVYDRSRVQATKYRAIKREIAMMMYFMKKGLPSIVEFHAAFHDDAHLYIVMEHCSGGDLLEKLLRKKSAMTEARVAADVALPCLAILARLHAMAIIHRDIKLENIFIDSSGRVKLGDFGLTMSMRQESAISPVGTVEYMAPEVVALPPVDLVVSGQIKATEIPPTNEKVDVWALGVTIFELVTGRLPFEGKDKPEIKRNITANNLAAMPAFLSPQCQSFIRAMLTYSPDQRPSCAQLLLHPYITMHCAQAPGKPAALPPRTVSLHAYSLGAAAQAMEARGSPAALPGPASGGGGAAGSGVSNEQQGGDQPRSAPQGGLPDALHVAALAGGAGAPAPQGLHSPRPPGGTIASLAGTTAAHGQHSPATAAQGGFAAQQDPFASPHRLQPQYAGSVPDFSEQATPGEFAGDGAGGMRQQSSSRWQSGPGLDAMDGNPRQSAGGAGLSSERRRSAALGTGMKTVLRKFFARRNRHERLVSADPASPMQSSSAAALRR